MSLPEGFGPGRPRLYTDEQQPAAKAWRAAKFRAKRAGVPFTITFEQCIAPDECPCCGQVMRRDPGSKGPGHSSPTLDRLIPDAGYTPDNMVIICATCNRTKNNASYQELYRIADFVYAQLKKRGRICDGGSGSDD